MKNSSNHISENEKQCLHSQICSVNNDDLIYRKSYKGDWGDWDDLPENNNSATNYDVSKSDNSSASGCSESTLPYENSYL
jgi:hypothetical protein